MNLNKEQSEHSYFLYWIVAAFLIGLILMFNSCKKSDHEANGLPTVLTQHYSFVIDSGDFVVQLPKFLHNDIKFISLDVKSVDKKDFTLYLRWWPSHDFTAFPMDSVDKIDSLDMFYLNANELVGSLEGTKQINCLYTVIYNCY